MIAALVLCFSCQRQVSKSYTYYYPGYYYRLLSYEPASQQVKKKAYIQLQLCFSTQNDSVFWDSFNNFNNLYVIDANDPDTSKILNVRAIKGALKDSFELLIPTTTFFSMQFKNATVPEFSKQDSVVRVRAKISRYISREEFTQLAGHLKNKELEQIRDFFKTEEAFRVAKDSLGHYWVERPNPWSPAPNFQPLDRLMLQYEGSFLNGRVYERSKTDFEFFYGIPDQLVKGLNNVMGQLNEGQTAKIILPSALAFGENGSSNGTVPPYTPVLYNLKLTEVKRK